MSSFKQQRLSELSSRIQFSPPGLLNTSFITSYALYFLLYFNLWHMQWYFPPPPFPLKINIDLCTCVGICLLYKIVIYFPNGVSIWCLRLGKSQTLTGWFFKVFWNIWFGTLVNDICTSCPCIRLNCYDTHKCIHTLFRKQAIVWIFDL